MDKDPDHALVERCRAGDWSAYKDLVVRYQRPIYNAAFWVLRKAEDANDVTQTVFLKVAERLDEYDPQHKFFSWIYRIAVNEALNVRRQNGQGAGDGEDLDFLPAPESGDPEKQASAAEVSRHIQKALGRMSTNDRMVITLRHFSELSYQEIATILDLDEKTVKSRLFEARHRLRGLLQELQP